jgi:hypothetical protein
MGRARAIDRGTMESISARREASPMTDSMWASSAALMPMWRAMNSEGFSRSPKGRAVGISMEGSGQNIGHGALRGMPRNQGFAGQALAANAV